VDWSAQVETHLSVWRISFVQRQTKAFCDGLDANGERALVRESESEERAHRHQELEALKILPGQRRRRHSRCSPAAFGAPYDVDLHSDGTEAGAPIGPPLQAGGSLIPVHRPSIPLHAYGCNGSVAWSTSVCLAGRPLLEHGTGDERDEIVSPAVRLLRCYFPHRSWPTPASGRPDRTVRSSR